MTAREALRKARRILRNPKRFCKGASAYDAEGNDVHPRSKQAKKFDAYGAICRVSGSRKAIELLANAAFELYECVAVPLLNDSRDGRRKILRCFDHAIKQG